ncbi:hypothetical protein CYK37_11780 [Mesorhizobium loti]|nr:hypothetical protein [Mesorhizobium loti]PLP59152.1 hypothetical protein CYK37_11780 [Mesorhizobium loti]
MSIFIDPRTIVCGTFGGLEPAAAPVVDKVDYWEDYTRRFFKSNGRDYTESESNVVRWLSADDRAPFVEMVRALLPILSSRADLSNIDLVILAHWLPDIHLGTSVTNFALHTLELTEGLGFAISDRGASAPLFALHCIERYLTGPRSKALLMVMDQKHLLYRSELVERIDPLNSASLVLVQRDEHGPLRYRGYRRHHGIASVGLAEQLRIMAQDLGLHPQACTLIADADIADQPGWPGPVLIQDRRLLCSAPFAALADLGPPGNDYLIVVHDELSLTGIGLSTG